MGGSNSSGTTQYIYLPTANGPMPIAAIVNGVAYAVHSDHPNNPVQAHPARRPGGLAVGLQRIWR